MAQDAVQQLLSVIFRLYVNNKNNFAVHSTAAATIRQVRAACPHVALGAAVGGWGRHAGLWGNLT